MARARAYLEIDFSGARAFVRNLKKTKGLKSAALRYQRYLQKRYRSYSMGGGDWPDLAESTRRRKKQNKDVILVEFMNLYNALSIRKSREGQYTVGIFSNRQARRSNKSLRQIATIHQQGRGRMPQREIVVLPSRGVYSGMVKDIKDGLEPDIRKANRGK